MNGRPSCVSHGAALYHGQPVRNVLWHRVWGCTKEQRQPSQPASQPAMLVCNHTAWVLALEHTVLTTENPCVCSVSHRPSKLEAWLWGLQL